MAAIQTRILELQQDPERAKRSERKAGQKNLEAAEKFSSVNFEFRYLNHMGAGYREQPGQKTATEIELDRLKSIMHDAESYWLATQRKSKGIHAVALERTKQNNEEIEREAEDERCRTEEMHRQRREEKRKRYQAARAERKVREQEAQKRATAAKEEEEAKARERRRRFESGSKWEEYTNAQNRQREENRRSNFHPYLPEPVVFTTRVPRRDPNAAAKWRVATEDFSRHLNRTSLNHPGKAAVRWSNAAVRLALF
ncbi:uncharacterized protein MYCGRDRAFT_90839 [Zymoseptoria tritici IPO323]|uniref:Uncharacterized protein n=1 Tax=Zymoseptoria tritici (strain CBS 115943 / IPO323) TaxID=336722 RepID=F9X4H8_ZYMTI|nr:uncharacterized protein MYCGRDRAFT_90839 [Zymoseptoria tritici IPO323]EGP89969.1 hypothetical protein MYCGRDRAFT_90839 [Zymoseptoria tritici IPO323]